MSKEVIDLPNSLSHDAKANANNPVASTSVESRYNNSKVEEEKIKIWRKYKNKYNYIEKLKCKLPSLNDTPQNNANSTVKNDLNDNTQMDLNEKKYTLNDIIQNENIYELFRSKLKNSPYDNPYIKNNLNNSNLTLSLYSGEIYAKPMRCVAPLVVLKKCDKLDPTPLQNKKTYVPTYRP